MSTQTETATPRSVLIVGGGQAAAQVVVSLRQEGYAGRITLVSAEAALPYQRPPLSKAFFAGALPEERLQIRNAEFYQRAEVELRLGVAAKAIRPQERAVLLESGEMLSYHALVLATGSRARRLDIPGADHPRLLALRSLAEARVLRQHCRPGARLVLVGGGYIGLELAATARGLGMEVCLLEAAPQLLGRVAGAAVGEFYRGLHRAHGVDLRCGAGVARIEGAATRPCVVTREGERLEADLVIAGVGAVPEMRLAVGAGLDCGNGIAVDECGRTSIPGIYAAGDCTEQPSPLYGGRIRLESVPNAIEQGRAVAAAICGKPRPAAAVPWFWSDQYEVKLQTAGLQQGHDRQVLRGQPAQRSFAVFYLQGERLLAVDAINRPAEFALAKTWIAERRPLCAERLADEGMMPKMIAA